LELRGMALLLRVVTAKVGRDDVLLRAAALSYSTLASLVPIFAIILAVLSGPAFQPHRDKVLDQLASHFVPDVAAGGQMKVDPDSPQEKFKQTFRETIRPLAEKMGAVSVFGFLILVAAVVLLFRAAENAFNAIWRVSNVRPFFIRVAIATSMIFWGPVMLAASVSVGQMLSAFPVVGTYVIPSVFTTLVFAAFYMVMPHARVRFTCALAGGVGAALGWEIAKVLFLFYVTHVVSYDKFYGSLGLIPMLFLWVYVNWVLILYGAELAYCLQERRAMVDEWLDKEQARQSSRNGAAGLVSPVLVLATAIEIARRVQTPNPGGVRASALAEALHVETGLAQHAAERLVAGGVLARVSAGGANGVSSGDDPAYLPTSEPRSCDVSAVLAATYDDRTTLGRGPAMDKARELASQVSASHAAHFGKLALAELAAEQGGGEAADGAVKG
jgi:membrane protein